MGYSQFYREIAARLDPATPGLIVELGSGLGNIKGDEIQWEIPAEISIHDCPYYAAQAYASRIFG
jgi:hypothetical protein